MPPTAFLLQHAPSLTPITCHHTSMPPPILLPLAPCSGVASPHASIPLLPYFGAVTTILRCHYYHTPVPLLPYSGAVTTILWCRYYPIPGQDSCAPTFICQSPNGYGYSCNHVPAEKKNHVTIPHKHMNPKHLHNKTRLRLQAIGYMVTTVTCNHLHKIVYKFNVLFFHLSLETITGINQ